jgi:hypothetical protein
VTLLAATDTVRIIDNEQTVAVHQRSYDRGRQIEDPRHIEALSAAKYAAGQHRRTNLLADAAPSTAELLTLMAERGLPLTGATNQLLELLHSYGAAALEDAVKEALAKQTPHPQAVRLVLERWRHEAGKPPALSISLPQDPRVSNLVLKPRSLTVYDQIEEKKDE